MGIWNDLQGNETRLLNYIVSHSILGGKGIVIKKFLFIYVASDVVIDYLPILCTLYRVSKA